MPRDRHPKKDVEKALQDLELRNWIVTSTASGHRWGRADCGHGCSISIWSTPKNAANHGKQLMRADRRCPHHETP